MAFSSYISWMILIWSLCLVLTLLVVTALVRRIVRPLLQLTEYTATVTADTLQNSHVQFTDAPEEIIRLADNYEELLERLSLSWSHQRQFVSSGAMSCAYRSPSLVATSNARFARAPIWKRCSSRACRPLSRKHSGCVTYLMICWISRGVIPADSA